MTHEHVDVIVVDAGLSGIGAMGGAWDLFRYLGVRSDSGMYTLDYRFRPRTDAKAIADGASIRGYVEDIAPARDPHRRPAAPQGARTLPRDVRLMRKRSTTWACGSNG